MALKNSITGIIQDGGIGSLPLVEDYICSLAIQSATKPSEYGTDTIKVIYSIKQAEALGINATDYAGAYKEIADFFRLLSKWNFNGVLYVGFFNIVTANYDGAEISTMQTFAEGKIRKHGTLLNGTFASSMVTDANTVAQALDALGTPLSVFLAAKVSSFTTVTDIRALDCKWVTCIAGMSGDSSSISLKNGAIGAMLASQAFAKVNENVGWVQKFDISGSTEFQTLALCDGTLLNTLTEAQIDDLNDKGWAVIVKRKPSGSYWYDCPTGSLITSDYIYQERNQAIGKVKRLTESALAPFQNGDLDIDPTTGYLSQKQIEKLIMRCNIVRDNMVSAGEVSGILYTISPTQNVLQNSKVAINCAVVPKGTARKIEISLSFTTKI